MTIYTTCQKCFKGYLLLNNVCNSCSDPKYHRNADDLKCSCLDGYYDTGVLACSGKYIIFIILLACDVKCGKCITTSTNCVSCNLNIYVYIRTFI